MSAPRPVPLRTLLSAAQAPPLRRRDAIDELLTSRVSATRTGRAYEFEAEVFSFLVEQREALEVAEVRRYKNLLVDGAVVLEDGRRIAIEIKLVMNWMKACQAGWQFRQFLRLREKEGGPPMDGGLVFFEAFSADWKRTTRDGTEIGWHYWDMGHAEVRTLSFRLLRLNGDGLTAFPGGAKTERPH